MPPSADLREMGSDLSGRFRALLSALPRTSGALGEVMGKVLAEARQTNLPPPAFIIAGIIMLVNLAVDIVHGLIDPRGEPA